VANRRTPRPITRRPIGTKEPKKRVTVVAEGSKTEPQYLALIQPLCLAALIEVEVVDEPATDPMSLVRRAVSISKKAREDHRRTKDPNSLVDEVWCMFDVDQHPFLGEACEMARVCDVRLAVSNPSFEIWLLLHFQEQTAFLSRSEAKRSLTRYLAGYNKTLVNFEPFLGRFDSARDRAKMLDHKHLGDGTSFPQNNPSSGVWRLIESIEGIY
jgi:hypothetical protein